MIKNILFFDKKVDETEFDADGGQSMMWLYLLIYLQL